MFRLNTFNELIRFVFSSRTLQYSQSIGFVFEQEERCLVFRVLRDSEFPKVPIHFFSPNFVKNGFLSVGTAAVLASRLIEFVLYKWFDD